VSAFHVKTVTLYSVLRRKRDSGGYDEEETSIVVQGRLYRRREGFTRLEARPGANGARLEARPGANGASPGITTVGEQLVLSLPLGTPIAISQTVEVDGVRYLVQDIREYSTGLQCDVERGAATPQKQTVTQ
jgi:hypothetical protein